VVSVRVKPAQTILQAGGGQKQGRGAGHGGADNSCRTQQRVRGSVRPVRRHEGGRKWEQASFYQGLPAQPLRSNPKFYPPPNKLSQKFPEAPKPTHPEGRGRLFGPQSEKLGTQADVDLLLKRGLNGMKRGGLGR
jgi:hypothetical protein